LFKPLTLKEKQNFIEKKNYFNHLELSADQSILHPLDIKEKTIMMISSTSWTKDEVLIKKILSLFKNII